MCRIFGYIGTKMMPNEILDTVSKLQITGGPDQQNYVNKTNWALGNNRLAIQGLDGGLQPFQLHEGIFVVFNGEIYNHNELRKQLIGLNYTFVDTCDGSILPAMYNEYGVDFVKYLDGMFAIAVIDIRNGIKLILATDPLGIKSIYYHWDYKNKTLCFSSEINALLSFPGVSNRIRINGIDDYMFGRVVWGPKTIFSEIYDLEPSTILMINIGQVPRIYEYSSLIVGQIESDSSSVADGLHNKIDFEVSRLMMADVPICVVTSGGLDSSYITALASKYSKNLHSFNVWYEGTWPNDERHFAKEVSKLHNTIHHQVTITEKDFPVMVDSMLRHIGQPNSAPHCLSTYALFNAVHNAGFKVALTGDGADELFGGYDRFIKAMSSEDENWLRIYLDKISNTTFEQRSQLYSDDFKTHLQKSEILFDQAADMIRSLINSRKDRLQALLEFDQMARFPYYILRRVDHLSMANSVEVRVPFCQPLIVDYSRKLKTEQKVLANKGKHILYQAANMHVPESILYRPKQPFLLPIASMLKRGHVLFEMLMDTISSTSFISRNIFNLKQIHSLIQLQLQSPSAQYAEVLWTVMIFELWMVKNTFNTVFNNRAEINEQNDIFSL